MKKQHNKTGLKYGKLTVLSKKERVGRNWHWECRCECGVVRFIDTCKLNHSKWGQKSCGCSQFPAREDLVGQKFGKLTVIKFSHLNEKQRHLLWHCICECGKKITVSTTSLRREDHPTRSCGCLRKEVIKASGFDYNRKEKGIANINSLIYTYKKNAKKKNISFNIPTDVFVQLTSQNCHYCNTPPNQYHKKRETNGPYIYNGLDRKDSKIGYEVHNLLPCCKTCNYAKRIMGYNEFLKWVESVFNYRVKIENVRNS